MILSAVSRWQCLASAVTTAPARSSRSINCCTAGISFDLSSTDFSAKHSFKPHTQADTECRADFPEALSNEPRSVLPSRATVSPLNEWAMLLAHDSHAA